MDLSLTLWMDVLLISMSETSATELAHPLGLRCHEGQTNTVGLTELNDTLTCLYFPKADLFSFPRDFVRTGCILKRLIREQAAHEISHCMDIDRPAGQLAMQRTCRTVPGHRVSVGDPLPIRSRPMRINTAIVRKQRRRLSGLGVGLARRDCNN